MSAIPIASAASCRFSSSSVRLNIFLITASISSLLALPFQLIYFLISWGVRSYKEIVWRENSIPIIPLTPYTNSALFWLRAVKNNFSIHTALIGYSSISSSKNLAISTILANWSFLVGDFSSDKITHDKTTLPSSSRSQYQSFLIPGSIPRYKVKNKK